MRTALLAAAGGGAIASLVLLHPWSVDRRLAQPEAPPPAVAATVQQPAPTASPDAAADAASALRKLSQVQPRAPEPTLDDVSIAILQDLGLARAEPPAPEDAALLAMTNTVLQGLAGVSGRAPQAPETPPAARPGLSDLVVAALQDGHSDAYIDALVNEAVGKGDVKVPSALITSEGRVDTRTLLQDLVARATREAGEVPEGLLAEATGGAGVELRLVQRADGAAQEYRFYTVQAGDSLGAIAVRFYGDVGRYMDVFEANRMILSSPDRIQIGQRLVIPSA